MKLPNEISANVAAIMARENITIDVEFIPLSKSRNAKEKFLTLNYRFTVKRDERKAGPYDYSMGSGHCPATEAKGLGMPNSIMRTEAIKRECETGKTGRIVTGTTLLADLKTIIPKNVDMICCVLRDAEVIDYRNFDDWASEFGYNPDSIKAKATYDECMREALELRALLGDALMAELRNELQDY